jgi:carbonic anhydrase/acetyltransferase-like protein (isoleucine patch superfamily)
MKEKFLEFEPRIAPDAWVHPSASVIGMVRLDAHVSVWPGAVIRGDVDAIEIGASSNIQDLAVLHPNRDKPVILGKGVTVGHGAVIHGSRVGDHCLIGMGAIVIDSQIGELSLIGAGAVVTPGSVIPPGSMVLGIPAKVVRRLKEDEKSALIRSKEDYVELARKYRGQAEGIQGKHGAAE